MTDIPAAQLQSPTAENSKVSPRRMLAPLALTQFVASFAGSNMNVAIGNISKDLHTTIHGVQTAITLFCCAWRR